MTVESTATNAVLLSREDLTDTLSIVRVRPDAGVVPTFHPGQFFRLGLPKAEVSDIATEAAVGPAGGVTAGGQAAVAVRPVRAGRIRYTRRAYSIASSPLVRDHAEFLVVRIDQGALTPRLWDLAPGDRLWMDVEAKGEFTMDVAPASAHLVMVSSGTGVAPFLSMLRTYRGQGRWRRFTLIHGVRYAADLAYRAELEAVCREEESVRYVPLVTREPEGNWSGLRGRVQVALEPATFERVTGTVLEPADCHVFLCGNPEMIDSVATLLQGRGFRLDSRESPGNVHFERYW